MSYIQIYSSNFYFEWTVFPLFFFIMDGQFVHAWVKNLVCQMENENNIW